MNSHITRGFPKLLPRLSLVLSLLQARRLRVEGRVILLPHRRMLLKL